MPDEPHRVQYGTRRQPRRTAATPVFGWTAGFCFAGCLLLATMTWGSAPELDWVSSPAYLQYFHVN